jgi:hypothetical protein
VQEANIADLIKSTPQFGVVLVALTLWASFAWGVPADPPAAEGEAEAAVEDPWAGVRISDAYDYAKCPRCGNKNEVRRPACYRCGYPLPRPSPDMTDSDMVFVPGKGYYREGTLLEPGGTRKDLWVLGVISLGAGGFILTLRAVLGGDDDLGGEASFMVGTAVAGVSLTAAGGALLIFGLATDKEPVYAFGDGEPYGYRERDYYALRPANSGGAPLKVEVTALGF